MLVLLFSEVHPFGSVTAEPVAVDIVTPEEVAEKKPEPALAAQTKPGRRPFRATRRADSTAARTGASPAAQAATRATAAATSAAPPSARQPPRSRRHHRRRPPTPARSPIFPSNTM